MMKRQERISIGSLIMDLNLLLFFLSLALKSLIRCTISLVNIEPI